MSKLFDPYHLRLRELLNVHLQSANDLVADAECLKRVPKLSAHYARFFRRKFAKVHPHAIIGKAMARILNHETMMPISLYVKEARWLNNILLASLRCQHTDHADDLVKLRRLAQPYWSYLTPTERSVIFVEARRGLSYLKSDHLGQDPRPDVNKTADEASVILSFSPYLRYTDRYSCFVLTDPVYKQVCFARALSAASLSALQDVIIQHQSRRAAAATALKNVRKRDPNGFAAYHTYAVAQIRCFCRHIHK